MKINWGTGIVIGMALFMSFIMYFVVKISTDKQYDYDLVTEEYYKHEMIYQKEIDDESNLNLLDGRITGTKSTDGWQLKFPENLDYNAINGTVFLYRPSNKQLDFQLPLKLSNSDLLIPDNRLLAGRWNITIQWKYLGKDYLYKNDIIY